MKRFLRHQWFLISLLLVVVLGFAAEDALTTLEKNFPKQALVAVVLFLMSFTLDAGAMWRAVRRPLGTLLAIVVNMGVLPLIAWGLSHWLSSDLALGLMLMSVVPCTLASAAVWTRRADGNDAIALVVTMVTNFSCFLVTPLWLLVMTGKDFRGAIQPWEMAADLSLIVVVPMAVGQLLRLRRPLGQWATRHKVSFSAIAQIGILAMVLFGSIRSGRELSQLPASESIAAGQWALMIAAVVLVHVIALFLGFGAGKAAGLVRADWIAVGVAGSQKTLMVGLYLATAYHDFFTGIAVLPMVAYHIGQLLLDTVVADRLRGRPLSTDLAESLETG